ncbi:helix-turn-helix domain-containing protein [Pediococcus inopinatus]|uniref:Helix-turn-helix domain-containing protein n=1 Tax=Pediococcus inopinatus TaxID=114090 RepID=A0ABZ0Q2E3_9LACO|nr:helix-turn-helix transcriptional regulator [Pediococcus inopinatus]WPC19323.1 helix-turn-helix domain-containing protein [Pediococcus inopinatus]WPC21114.1 helix-turn-helix domain-containing protein [Pediococcus inopinatus]
MSTVSRIKELANKRNLNLKQLSIKLGMGENTIYRWDKKQPTSDRLQKVADYLNVSTDYLLGRSNKTNYYDLNKQDIVDIGVQVDRMLEGLDSESETNFYGEPMTEEDKQKLRIAMQAALQAAQIESRKKFTPKKYRK